MRKLFTILFVLITFFIHAQSPGIEWQKSLGGSSYDESRSIQQTTDGGYISCGSSGSANGDVSGNHGGSGRDEAYSIQQTKDAGYIVCGYSESSDGDVSGSHGGGDYWIIKLNKSGNIVWQKCLGGSSFDFAHCIQQTKDGGYIVGGGS